MFADIFFFQTTPAGELAFEKMCFTCDWLTFDLQSRTFHFDRMFISVYHSCLFLAVRHLISKICQKNYPLKTALFWFFTLIFTKKDQFYPIVGNIEICYMTRKKVFL